MNASLSAMFWTVAIITVLLMIFALGELIIQASLKFAHRHQIRTWKGDRDLTRYMQSLHRSDRR